MALRPFALQVAVMVACLAAMNAAVIHLARNANARSYARSIRSAPPCTDLFVGHSLVAGGINAGAFDDRFPGARALNIGMNSTGPVEHYLLLEQASRQSPARLYYGFVNEQLTHRPEDDPTSDLIGNRGMVYYPDYFDTEAGARMYAGDNPLRYWSLRTTSVVPMLREQSTMWQRVEQWRRSLGAIGMPTAQRNRFGRVDDMGALSTDLKTFDAEIRRVVATRRPLSRPVLAMSGWASRRRATFYLILMPVTRAHRARYYASPQWAHYRDHLTKLLSDAGGVLVPAEDWIGDDGFEDAIHLSVAGAKDFSARLARWVADRSGSVRPR